jgi:hypothetical protein
MWVVQDRVQWRAIVLAVLYIRDVVNYEVVQVDIQRWASVVAVLNRTETHRQTGTWYALI